MNAFEVCGTILAIAFGALCAYPDVLYRRVAHFREEKKEDT